MTQSRYLIFPENILSGGDIPLVRDLIRFNNPTGKRAPKLGPLIHIIGLGINCNYNKKQAQKQKKVPGIHKLKISLIHVLHKLHNTSNIGLLIVILGKVTSIGA